MTAARWLYAACACICFGAAAQDTYTLLIFGDSGTGNGHQRRVAAAMGQACRDHGCDAALVVGDLIYPRGVSSIDDRRFTSHFEEPYAVLGPLPFWMAPGNHDHRRSGSVEAQIAYARSGRSQRWRMPAAHYAVEGLPPWLHIYSLDTVPIDDEIAGREQADGARTVLCGQAGWRLLMGHHPIYSNGRHGDSAAMRSYLDGLIGECGVQAYFAGHDHHQEHISTDTIEQFVQGAAAKLRGVRAARYPPERRMVQRFARSTRGFAIAAFTERAMDIRFFDAAAGAEIYACRATIDRPACMPP